MTETMETINVSTTTWNMGNKAQGGLDNVLKKEILENDIICIGLQESTYTQKLSRTVSGLTTTIREELPSNIPSSIVKSELTLQLENMVGKEFYKVEHCKRAQLQLYIFARTALKGRITNVQKSVENTGFLGVFPNKGGLLCTFSVDGTKLAFVSCHLTAHEGPLFCAQRNASIAEILGGVRAGDERFDITEQFHHVLWMGDMNYRTTFSSEEPTSEVSKRLSLKHTEFFEQMSKNKTAEETEVIQLLLAKETSESTRPSPAGGEGENLQHYTSVDTIDLEFKEDCEENSEVDDEQREEDQGHKNPDKKVGSKNKLKKVSEEDAKKTYDMIQAQKWEELLTYDELNREIKRKRILTGFTALQPNFPPTFKRERGPVLDCNDLAQGGIDIRSYYNAQRLPSFTDRVLYKSMSAFKDNLIVRNFTSCELAVSSDHKPVTASFTITVTPGIKGILGLNLPASSSSIMNKGMKMKERKERRVMRKQCCLNLSFSDLKGHHLKEMDAVIFGLGGKSDPYVCITSDPPSLLCQPSGSDQYKVGSDYSIKSDVVMHDINPVWKEPMSVRLSSIDIEGLTRNASLILSVWDWDRTNADDLIGNVSFAMRDILAAKKNGQSLDFNTEITNQSEINGSLSGKITVEGDWDAIKDLLETMKQQNNMRSIDEISQKRRDKGYQSCCAIV